MHSSRIGLVMCSCIVAMCVVACSSKPSAEPEPSSPPSPELATEPGTPQPTAANDSPQEPAAAEPKPEPARNAPVAAPAEPKAVEREPKSAARAEKPAPKSPVAAPDVQTEKASPAVATAGPSATVAGPCGEKGQTRCPLQAWMEDHLQAALDAKDAASLAKGLMRVPSFVPDASWNAGAQGWSALANAGLDAAKKGDIAGTQATCKSCHKAWRAKYKQAFRLRAIAD